MRLRKIIFVGVGAALLTSLGFAEEVIHKREAVAQSLATACEELDWSSFFESLPKELFDRVKRRETVTSVRILTNEETGGSTAVKVFSTKGEEPAHTHFETKQMFIVLDGELICWKVSKEEGLVEQRLKRGEYIFINPGESHGFRGSALVGGVDVGKGTALDTYQEGEYPSDTTQASLPPILPMSQGVITKQMPGYEQRELLASQHPNLAIMAETITSEITCVVESKQLAVVVSGELEIEQNGSLRKLQPGDFVCSSAGEAYVITPLSETPVVTIIFSLPEANLID